MMVCRLLPHLAGRCDDSMNNSPTGEAEVFFTQITQKRDLFFLCVITLRVTRFEEQRDEKSFFRSMIYKISPGVYPEHSRRGRNDMRNVVFVYCVIWV